MSTPGPSLRGAVDLSGLVRRANTPPPVPGSVPPPSTSGFVVEVNDASFQQVVDLSARVPVVVEFYAAGLTPALGALIESYGGRLVLATVDAQANPGIAEAFQVREVPAAAAIVAGRPVPLFVGIPAEDQVRQVLDQLLDVAKQNGVTGSLTPPAEGDEGEVPAEPVEEPLPPLHQEAFDAISSGDYAAAVAAYQKAIVQNPRDTLAVAGLAQASLLLRLDGAVADDVRKAAADAPASVAAQLAVADLDVSGGHLDDAFDRLLELFPSLDAAAKDIVRARILEYFEIAGADDPRVSVARRRLTLLLY
ncbi:MAG: tetratricopeptide repeat protein [Pseudolysinimonas sp.]|uniref:tetratricopeptide repeat protein n=1 Tax=Pseudolysinimonas sp. TaxID=2680009 RepID=UPI00326611C2